MANTDRKNNISNMAINLISSLLMVFLVCADKAQSQTLTFDIRRFGAVEGGKTDSREALLDAWRRACSLGGTNIILVPRGMFLLSPVTLIGPCQGRIQLHIEGTLVASTATSSLNFVYWIAIRYIDNLIITGNGVLYGQGESAWKYNDCATNPKCKTLPTTMRLDFVNNARIHHIASVNSKNTHLNIFSCQNVTLDHMKLIAPDESPNTDGIKMAMSSNINIRHSVIRTGDDCIAILPGSQRIHISHILCGPGHGISIGSLGGSPNEKPISSVWVENCVFRGTTNGLRIKTRAPSYKGLVSDITFAHITVKNTANPILIEQQYCPSKNCDPKKVSLVAIRDVTFRNITGSSSTKVAENIQCSPAVPCLGINLHDIDLSYNGDDGDVTSSCTNVIGSFSGKQNPATCVNRKLDYALGQYSVVV